MVRDSSTISKAHKPMAIRQLPQDAVVKLKSSTVILSLNDAVVGLLANAVDAGATRVNVMVDYPRGSCTAEDNGCGIPPSEFQETGGLAKPHHTSRCPPNDHFHGRHGNFLASLATFSLLCICSRSQSHIPHSSILMQNSTTLSRNVHAPPEQRLRTFDHGTRVIVRDLFGTMPVRVKQRPDASTDRASIDKSWMRLVHDCVAMLLSCPRPVSVMLREANGNRELRLRSAEDVDALRRISSLLVHASLANSEHARCLEPVGTSHGEVQITGYISTRPVASKRTQFISMGVRPIPNDRGTNILYEEVNRVFLNSRYSATEEESDSSTAGSVSRREKGSSRRADRWPMFHLQIMVCDATNSHDLDDLLNDKGNDLSAVLDLLKRVCYAFLKKHHFSPDKANHSKTGSKASTPLSRKSAASECRSTSRPRRRALMEMRPSRPSLFDGWQRTKAGHDTAKKGEGNEASSTILPCGVGGHVTTSGLIGECGPLRRMPFDDDVKDSLPGPAPQDSGYFKGAGTQQRLLEPRGSTYGPQSQPQQRDSLDAPTGKAPLPIPRLYDENRDTLGETGAGVQSKYFNSSARDYGVMFESGSVNLPNRIAKSSLARAEVIGQVDRKFILVKMPLSDGGRAATNTLVMLDQHAVDERCKLEDLMLDYFEAEEGGGIRAKAEVVDKPVIFELADQDLELLAQYRAHLGSWGIVYGVQRSRKRNRRGECDGTGHVRVTALPPSIAERCRTEPGLLAELLRKEVWNLYNSGRPVGAPSLPFVERATWVSNFHRCPGAILELLHSRSCRSAIMFNDALTTEECEALLERLAWCSFPFQCAHGRPSSAPLVDLGSGSRVGSWQENRVSPWDKWLATK